MPDALTHIAIAGRGVQTFKQGAGVIWDGRNWTIVNVGLSEFFLKSDDEASPPITLGREDFHELVRQGKLQMREEERVASARTELTLLLMHASDKDWDAALRKYEIIKPHLEWLSLKNGIGPNGRCAVGIPV